MIKQGLGSSDAEIRAVALSALQRLGRLDTPQLAVSMADESDVVRRRAAELAARVPGASALEEPLKTLLSDSDIIAEVTAFTLGEIGSEAGVELQEGTIVALEHQALHHEDALCREAAVAALGALHRSLPVILQACTDKATVRRRAVIALAPFDGPDVDAALRVALQDRDWQVRQAAEDQLNISGDSDQS